MTERQFQKGDVVKCVRGSSSRTFPLIEGQEYTVSTVHTHGDVSLEGEKDQNCGWFASRFTLVRPAPLSDSKEPAKAWVPAVGDRVQPKGSDDDYGRRLRAVLIEALEFGGKPAFRARWEDDNSVGIVMVGEIEPAPPLAAVEGGQGKANCVHSIDHRSECCCLCGMSAEEILSKEHPELPTKDTRWDSEKHPAPGFWTSLDSRIAAARAELDRPATAPRFAKYEGGPWQEWPKGWDDEP